MSAGICGKRLGFEEIFGSPAPSAKKIRFCSGYGSPIRSADFGFGSDDKAAILLRMFPSMDRELSYDNSVFACTNHCTLEERYCFPDYYTKVGMSSSTFPYINLLIRMYAFHKVVETVLKSHDHKIDDAIKSLHALCLGDGSAQNESAILNSLIQSNDNSCEGGMNAQPSEQKIDDIHSDGPETGSRIHQNGSSWVDAFVQEMMNASNWDDVRSRAMKILEAFEKNVLDHSTASKEQEIASLKEQLQCLLRENQILKKAVTIQHERNLEQDEKLKEVEQLKHIISQYQEQVRQLELHNYSLKVHLQRAQEGSSMPGHFHPDIF